MLTNLTLIIVSQCRHILNYHTVYLTLKKSYIVSQQSWKNAIRDSNPSCFVPELMAKLSFINKYVHFNCITVYF